MFADELPQTSQLDINLLNELKNPLCTCVGAAAGSAATGGLCAGGCSGVT